MKNVLGKIKIPLFLIIVVVGVFFRLWRLDKAPVTLFGDEIDVGLQAYSILTTGKDYLGNKMPVMFHSFSEYRLPMQLYLDVPFISIFGLNEIGVRAASILLGFLSLILFYFLIKEFFNVNIALIGTVFLLFSPWHFNFSRQANDAGILLPFILGGTLFFIKGLKNYKYFLLSAILFSLSIYSYAIASLFTPLFVITLIIIFRKEVFKYSLLKLFLVSIIGIIIITPYVGFTLKGVAGERFAYISISSNNQIMQQVVDRRRWSNSFLTRAFYNNSTVFLEVFFKNYLRCFSTPFLFSEGDPNMRQGIEGFGQMYHFDIILVFLGLVWLLYKISKGDKDKNNLSIIFLWLLFAPIPSSLTKDGGYHASRLILMLPPLIILSALGFNLLLKSVKDVKMKFLVLVLILFMVIDVTRFIHRYFVIWPNESWRFWQSGFKETLSYVKEIDGNYSRIYFNSTYEPMLPRFLFWYKYDMLKFQREFTDDKHIAGIVPGFNGFKLGDKYYFGEIIKPVESLANQSSLVVASGEKDISNPQIFENSKLLLLNVFYSPTKIPIFYVFTARK